jgi:hypothetical protein
MIDSSIINQNQFQSYLGPYAKDILGGNPALQAQYGAYTKAYNSLSPSEAAALGSYDIQTGNEKNQALGSLNARGLGRSLMGNLGPTGPSPVSGYGSGALTNLAASRLSGRNALSQGYSNEADALNQGLIGSAYGASNFYQQLAMQKKALEAQKNQSGIDLGGIIGTGISLASIL